MGNDVATFVGYGNVHGLSDFRCFLLSGSDYAASGL
jgi:hypothetical protein